MSERRIKIRYQLDGADEFKRRHSDLGDSATRSFNRMSAAAIRYASAAAAAFSVREIVQYADAYKTLENRIKVTNDGIGDVTQTLNRLYDISQKTRVPLDGTVTLFQRASMAANELGASQNQLFQFTENVSKALAIQGGSAASASGALLQLSQALGSGVVRAEEFNSILEGAFPIAQAAARGIEEAGGSVAKLRQLIAAGDITSKEFFDAILSQTEQLGITFAQTSGTVGQAFQALDDSFTRYIGNSEAATASSQLLADAVFYVAENMESLVEPVNDIVIGIKELNDHLPNTSAFFNNIAISGIALGQGLGLIDESIAKMAIAEGLQRSGQALGAYAKYADQAAASTRKFVNEATIIERDENSAAAIIERVSGLKAMAEGAEMSAETKAALAAEIMRLDARLKAFNKTAEGSALNTQKKVKEAAEKSAKALKEQTDATDDLQKQMAEEFNRPFENAMENVQRTVADTFEGVFDGSVDSAGDAAAAMKRIFTRLAAEMATLAIFRPQVFAQGGVGGLGGSMVSGATTQAGGFGGIGDLLSLGNNLSDGLSAPMFGGTISRGINSVGASLGLNNANFIGPMQPGTSNLASGFTGGAALAGFAGNMGANLLFGSRGMGADIGGMAGGLAGTAIGANMGTILGFAGGPAGALIGAFAGNALGGLFGNSKPSDKGQFATAGIDGSLIGQGGLEGKKFSQENRDAAISLAQLGGSITDLLDNISGVSAGFDQIRVKIGNRDSNFVAFGQGGIEADDFQFTGRSQEALMEAMIEGIVSGLDGLPEDLASAMRRIDFSGDLEAALADVNFVAAYDSLGEVPVVISEVEARVEAMRMEFAKAAQTAERLGLAVSKVNAAEQQALAEMNRSASQSISAAILGITNPGQLAVIEEQKRFEQQLADLEAIGASQETINQAQLLHQLQMQQAVSQTGGAVGSAVNGLRSLSGAFDKLLDDLRFGRFSGQSPSQNLAVLEAEVQALAAAPEDDVEAKARLGELLPAFLELSAAQNGFNTEYAKDRDWAERVAVETLNDADRQVALMEQQLTATVSGFAGLNQSIQELMDSFGVTSEQLVSSAGSSAPAVQFNSAAYLAANRDVAAYIQQNPGYTALQHYNEWGKREGRALGFAAGGLVTGGLPGVDSVPILAMQGERVLSVPHSRMMEDIYAMARRANNDNRGWQEVASRLERMEDRLSRILVAVGEGIVDSQERHRRTTERLTEKPRFAV